MTVWEFPSVHRKMWSKASHPAAILRDSLATWHENCLFIGYNRPTRGPIDDETASSPDDVLACHCGAIRLEAPFGGVAMATLDLTPEEAGTLLEILRNYLSDLRLEIGDTKKKAYRDDLKKREGLLKTLIERLEAR